MAEVKKRKKSEGEYRWVKKRNGTYVLKRVGIRKDKK